MSQPRQLCTFYLQNLLFGVEVEQVQEVIRYQEMTRIPLAPAVVAVPMAPVVVPIAPRNPVATDVAGEVILKLPTARPPVP